MLSRMNPPMPVNSRFDHGSTLYSLRLGPEDGHFAIDRDGYAFRRRTAIPRNVRILSIAARDAHSDEHVVDYSGKGDRLEDALSISGSGAIGAGLDGLGIRRDRVIRDEAAFQAGNFLLMVDDERHSWQHTTRSGCRVTLEIHKRLGGQNHDDQCF